MVIFLLEWGDVIRLGGASTLVSVFLCNHSAADSIVLRDRIESQADAHMGTMSVPRKVGDILP